MRTRYFLVAVCVFTPSLAWAQGVCSREALPAAAKAVAEVRSQLHTVEVSEGEAQVPAAAATRLATLKQALTDAANAALACASRDITPERLQETLAQALHANVAAATESADTEGKKDIGAYGSDLAVQVFQLFGTPRWFEVDFRYGVECGDDNLLLVYDAGTSATDPWRLRLRWDAPQYSTVADAIGDFVLLTPLTGSYKNPTWRFLVAHGHPGCAEAPRPSRFDLDLLAPTADPDKPRVDWHFEHAYTQGATAPRLATTEDTIDFRLVPAVPAGSRTAPGVKPEAGERYTFHLNANGSIEPSAPPAEGSAEAQGETRRPADTTTHSPQ